MDLATARDKINGALKGAVDAYNAANSTSYPIFYEDTDGAEAAPNSATTPNFRIYIRHNLGDQETLGGVGSRRFSRAGVVMVQVMTPFGDGFTLNDLLATVARNAFEGISTPNGVWFRRVATKEIGKSGPFVQTNVTADFYYTETR